jgi:DNA-directed RNA polymerase subunit RPC12/RpoP
MIVVEFRCTRCGREFEVQCIDREDPREEHDIGGQVRCDNERCRSTYVKRVRVLRRIPR